MKFKNKGRKIYKTKEKNYYGKSPMGKFLSGALTVLLIGGIGFLGYSVAEPIINYTKHKGDEPAATEPPVTEPVTTAAVVTSATMPAPTEAPTEPVTEEYYTAASLKVTDLANIDALKSALASIPKSEEISYIELPVKVSGGEVYYASSVYEAQAAVKSTISLSEMIKEIENSGFKAAAVISIFRDNLVPINFPDAGYVLASDGSQWYDKDNKLWASPYSQRAIDYSSSLVLELTNAGFKRIICSDFVFPDFTEYDLQNLDPILSKNDRCMSLTSTANLLYDNAVSNGASMQIEVSAEDILCNRKDILQPMLLSSNNIILNIEMDRLANGIADGETIYEFEGSPAEMVEQCLILVNGDLVDFNTTIKISGMSISAQDLSDIKKAVSEYGYKSFVIG